jgi:hypothetical protein
MPQPDLPFVHRRSAPALVTLGSPGRRLIVLVLTGLALAGGVVATLPIGYAPLLCT